MMDEKQRLQLQNMIKTNNVEDQTQLIRDLKHSHILQTEINVNIIYILKTNLKNRLWIGDSLIYIHYLVILYQ